MKGNKNNLPKKLKMGTVGKSQQSRPPATFGKGKIDTTLKDIKWTPRKRAIVSIVLISPVVFATIISINVGNYLVACIMVGLFLFVGLMYLALRYIDNNEF